MANGKRFFNNSDVFDRNESRDQFTSIVDQAKEVAFEAAVQSLLGVPPGTEGLVLEAAEMALDAGMDAASNLPDPYTPSNSLLEPPSVTSSMQELLPSSQVSTPAIPAPTISPVENALPPPPTVSSVKSGNLVNPPDSVIDSIKSGVESASDIIERAIDLCPHFDISGLTDYLSALLKGLDIGGLIRDALDCLDLSVLEALIDCFMRVKDFGADFDMDIGIDLDTILDDAASSGNV
jgi:hypothetical protein